MRWHATSTPAFYFCIKHKLNYKTTGKQASSLSGGCFSLFAPFNSQSPVLTRLTAATFLRAEKALNRMQSHYQIWGVLKFHAAATASSCCRMLPGVNYKSKGLE
jgi:hypothetical protein